MIVVFSGPPCSGKSYIGERLAAGRGLIHLEMDAIRMRLLPEAEHTRADRVLAYRAMHLAAEVAARAGGKILVNACYGHASDRYDLEQSALRAGAALYVVEFRINVEPAVARWRLRKETHPGIDLTEERVRALVNGFPYTGCGLTVCGERPEAVTLREIEDYVDRGSPVLPGAWSGRVL